MISQFAIDEIEVLQADGLRPTPADIVRLNALGIKSEAGPRAAENLTLPRVAYLGKLCFREPAIGHSIWMSRILKETDAADMSSMLAVIAFALSRSVDALPDADDLPECAAAIRQFAARDLKPFTLAQINCAVDYALSGCDPTARERAPDEPDAPSREAVLVGVLYGTVALGLGLTVAEVSRMTSVQIAALRETALLKNGIDIAKNARTNSLAEFFAARDEIRARLESASSSNNSNTSSNG